MAVIKNKRILKCLLMMVISLLLVLNFSIGVSASSCYDRQEADAHIAISERLSVKGGSGKKTLYHYTNEKGLRGITESNQLNPSLKANNPKDARHGNGQYLSDINPDSTTPAKLASKFISYPNKYKYTYYIEIDVTDLNVVQGREGVYVIPNEEPLDLTGRIINSGKVGD